MLLQHSSDVKQVSTTNLTALKGKCLHLNPLWGFLSVWAIQLAGPGPGPALEEFCAGPWSVLQLLWISLVLLSHVLAGHIIWETSNDQSKIAIHGVVWCSALTCFFQL